MLVPAAVIIGIISPFIPGLARRLSAGTGKWLNRLTTAAAVLLAAYWVLFGMSFFGYVFVKNQSPGAVDDAASVAVLIELAKDLNDGKVKPAGSSVTILLTSGEELNLLGALEYVRRFLPEGNTGRKVPVMLVNLDIIGQPGNLAFAERTGVFLRHWPADAGLAAEVGKAWQAVSGRPMETGKSGTDDSVCFLERGIPSVSIYHTGVPGPGLGGYHSAADSIQRVDLKNMEMTLMAMEKMIEGR
jgi:Zn-dependent M28 family amino/carboxypeptidase